jgi:cyclopropane-fatty-acyl-phospholipid synthase
MSLRHRFFKALRARLGAGGLPLRIVFWDGEAFDFAPAPAVTIALGSRRLLRRFLSGDMGRLAEAYVAGELAVDGRVEDVLRVGIALAERLGKAPVLRRLAPLAARWPRRHSKARDAQWVRYHYDVSNEFYRLWLDRHMVYSCAYFMTGAEDLDTAQEQKLDHICKKLRLAPGERLLDIGCGWGGLLIWAAGHYGISGVGVTLSRPQAELARQRAAEAGLAERLEFRVEDYRDIAGEGEFDKIVSVGMYEHVGIANLPLYFATIARLLKPGGLMLNHGITAGDPDGRAQGPPGGDFITASCFLAARYRTSRAHSTRSPAPASKFSTSRICARTTPGPSCIGCAAWKPHARRRSPPPASSATASGASTWPAWRTPSTAAGSRSRKCWQ